MIISADGLDTSAPIETDLCIVGAGPVGIAIALELAAGGRDILLLESGGRRPDLQSQALCRGEVADPALHSPADTFRRRGLGGSSTIWGGRCAPFDPIDFRARDWLGLERGWPIAYADMLPYWRRASRLCELGDFDYAAGTALAGGMRPMLANFADAAITTERIERFSRPTDFGSVYGSTLAQSRNVTVLLHATCISIALAENTRAVEHLHVDTQAGQRLRVRARAYVLAAGGLEIPRILLASRARSIAGVGNGHDQVGRHYMCHIAGTTGAFRPRPGHGVWHGYDRAAEGVYCRRRFSVEDEAQQSERIGNAVARFHHPPPAGADHRTGALSAIYLGRRALGFEYATRVAEGGHRGEGFRHVGNILRDPVRTAVFLGHALVTRRLAARKYPSVVVVPRRGDYALDIHAEQLPNPQSRIMLGREPDRFGVPCLRIDWRYQAADIHTVTGLLRLLAQALRDGGHGSLAYDPAGVEVEMLRLGAYGGHHIGTARMSEAPRHGVVDADCRVHGVENLYVCGSAVFPTSGQANPTFTAVALAIRLADHLRPRLSAPVMQARALSPTALVRQVAIMSA